jgi:hypothetical protein
MTAIVRRNCLRLVLLSGLWVGVFSISDAPVTAQDGWCGDNVCEFSETDWCDLDCPRCGDSICHPSEQTTCYYDCAP